MLIKTKCTYCKKVIYKQSREVRVYKKSFCSSICQGKYRTDKAKVRFRCLNCGKYFFIIKCKLNKRYKGKYCSVACYGLFKTGKAGLKRKVDRYCGFCGKPVKMKFCSNYCQYRKIEEDIINKWKEGKDGYYGQGIPSAIRRYLLKESGNKCSKCGWYKINPYSKRHTLQINHINGNPYDNTYGNHEVLCPNCHSLTKHWGNLNVGNGRIVRKRNVEA